METARRNLMDGFGLSELQAQAILDMRLARLAALERQKIEDEYLAVIQLIAELEDILALLRAEPSLSRTTLHAARNAALDGLDTGAMNA